MAMATSWDCSLPAINHCSSHHSFPSFRLRCKTFLLSCHFPLCRIPSLRVNSSRVSSSVLEHQGEYADLSCVNSASKGGDLNEFLCGLLQDPESQELGYWYYEEARENTDFQPNESTLGLLLRRLVASEKWDLILRICDDMKKYEALPPGHTSSRVVSDCIRSRKFRVVKALLNVFESESSIASWAYESAMVGYNELKMFRTTVILFERMKFSGISPNVKCYCCMVEACQRLGRTNEVLALFDECRRTYGNFAPYSSRMYWALCASLARSGREFEALEYFRDMAEKGIPEDPSFYSLLICSFANAREVKVAEELLKEAQQMTMLKDPETFLRVVLMYVEKGLVERTVQVVKIMRETETKVSDCILCAVVNGFSKQRGFKSAVRIYEELVNQGCEPGQVTYASIINAYCRLGLHSKAEMTFKEMEEKGFDKCLVAYSNMVAMYGKTRRTRDARRLVAKMKQKGCEPNIWVYNALLDMHGRAMDLRNVEKTWKMMRRKKVVPDKVSYTSVISAYNKAREFDRCVAFYQEFRATGKDIDRVMAGVMVGVFSKTGRIDELVKLLGDITAQGTKLDARLYHSALNAFRDAGLQTRIKWLQSTFKTSRK